MIPTQGHLLQPLTAKEKKVLEFIEAYLSDHGISPSYKEIKDYFGLASFNSVQRYLKQLQQKKYIHIPGDNQKRAITILASAQTVQSSLSHIQATNPNSNASSYPPGSGASPGYLQAEPLTLPLLGRVAAGQPLEAFDHDEFIDVPPSFIRNPAKSFALKVEGQSMIEDGILDGDLILIHKQSYANNGDIIVATVDNESTVKRFYLHRSVDAEVINKNPQLNAHLPLIELRPANSTMKSMWFSPSEVDIQGVVVGLLRRF